MQKYIFNRSFYLIFCMVSLAAILRVYYWQSIQDTSFLQLPIYFKNSDMHLSYIKAKGIAGGDILGENLDVFVTDWMRDIAPEETWLRWAGGKNVYHREPLYEYWVSLIFSLSGEDLKWVLAAQCFLGLILVFMVWDLVRIRFGFIAANVAAFFVAFYGPLIFYQASLLRDSFFVFFQVLWIWFLVCESRSQSYYKFFMFFAGMTAAFLFQIKATSILFVAATGLIFFSKLPKKLWISKITVFLIGFLICLTPLALRNWSQGLKAFQVGSPLAPTLIAGFAPESGVYTLRASSVLKPWLVEADGKTLGVLSKISQAYTNQPFAFLEKIFHKILAILQRVEISDNLNYEYAYHLNSIFFLLPTWSVLCPLAILGAFILLLDPKKSKEWIWIFAWIVTCTSSLMIVPMGRYRLELVTPLAILVGVWLNFIIELGKKRKSTKALLFVFAGMIGIFLWSNVSVMSFMDETHNRFRFVEYGMSGKLYAMQNRFTKEREEYESYIHQFEHYASVNVSPDVHALVLKSYLDEMDFILTSRKDGEVFQDSLKALLLKAKEESLNLNSNHQVLLERLSDLEKKLSL